MAVNCSMAPNMPRFEIVKVPPVYSSGFNLQNLAGIKDWTDFPSLAFLLRTLISSLIARTPFA